jgi:hypothetical protein
MNSKPKQKPLRERTIAVNRECTGVSNSTSRRSPGLTRIPAYKTIPPSLNSVPRPGTTVVEKPFAVTTRTGISTGKRGQRRVFGEDAMVKIIVLGVLAFKLRLDIQAPGLRYRRTYGEALMTQRLLPIAPAGSMMAS